MKVYFLSNIACVLRLNGIYYGKCDLFERFIRIDEDGIVAEFFPTDPSFCPTALVLNESLYSNPPPNVEIYRGSSFIAVKIVRYERLYTESEHLVKKIKNPPLKIAVRGGVFSEIELESPHFYSVFAYPTKFDKISIRDDLLFFTGKNTLAIVNMQGNQLYFGSADCYAYENGTLTVTLRAENLTQTEITSVYSYQNGRLLLQSANAVCKDEVRPALYLYAAIERMIYGCDFTEYLSDGLKDDADEIREYLKNPIAITPTLTDEGETVATLVYPNGTNKFVCKTLRYSERDGKIDNLFLEDSSASF